LHYLLKKCIITLRLKVTKGKLLPYILSIGASKLTEEKRKRIKRAVAINAILLVVILVAVVIYQIVTISILAERKKQLEDEYYQLTQQLEQCEDMLEREGLEERLYVLALKLGYEPPTGTDK
jgi:Tfp pilus assembly protein PilN